MEQIILDLHQVLDKGKKVIQNYESKTNNLSDREAKVLAREVSVDEREKALQPRELACQQVENAQKLMDDAQALMNASNLRLNRATEAEKDLARVTEEQHSLLRETRLTAQKEANALEVAKKRIDDEVSKRVAKVLSDLGIKQPA